MELRLHANATTTPKVRAYIQSSKASVAVLAAELGVSETTIRRWRGRGTVANRSHAPKTLAVSLSPIEETLVCELRARLQLHLDDIVEVTRRCLNAKPPDANDPRLQYRRAILLSRPKLLAEGVR
jgi:hypothetical protein